MLSSCGRAENSSWLEEPGFWRSVKIVPSFEEGLFFT